MFVRRVVLVALLLGFAASSAFAASIRELVPTAAPRGARVVIAGAALDDTDLVMTLTSAAGTVPVTIVSRTSTLAEAIVPSAAVSGPVRVSTSGGAPSEWEKRARRAVDEIDSLLEDQLVNVFRTSGEFSGT